MKQPYETLLLSSFILLSAFVFKLGLSFELLPEDAQRYHDIKRASWEAGAAARAIPRLPRRPIQPQIHKRPSNLHCGSYSSIAVMGPVSFTFNSPNKICGHAFIGSKAQNCTVAIMCKDTLTIQPPKCGDGFVTFWDGTSGMMNACGTFGFYKIPRYPQNGGSDMYVKYKGQTNSGSVCTAFCKEDLTEAHFSDADIKKPKKLKSSTVYAKPVKDKECTCGKKSEQAGRVVGGESASPFEFPWLAALVFRGFRGMERKTICGATLISNRYVLSAAHCFSLDFMNVTAENVQVILHTHVMDYFAKNGDKGTESKYQNVPGFNLPPTKDEDEGSLRLNVRKLTLHPLFNMYTSSMKSWKRFDFDVAVLELAEPVDIRDKRFTPACLPDMGKVVNYPSEAMFTLSGWGFDREKAFATSRIVNKLDVPLGHCKEEWHGSPRHICAGYLQGGKDACQGDSGGPLIYKFKPETNQYMLGGIVSAGNGCARPNQLGFYTNVQELLQWIYFKLDAPDNKFCSA